MATEVTVPVLGESITEATLGEWLKQPGDPVAVDEPIASLETDKVAVEVPSPVAGVMGEYRVQVGDTVEVGAVIATIADAVGAGEEPAVAKREEPQPAAQQAAPPPAAAPVPDPDIADNEDPGPAPVSGANFSSAFARGVA